MDIERAAEHGADLQPARIRDRNATADRLLQAAMSILAAEGFSKFGINSVARRAGCDKQLIYRYFGGMDGLVDAIGAATAGWVDARMPEQGAGGFLLTYGDLIERLLLLFLDALRDDPLMRKIITWEMAEANSRVRRLAEARTKAMMRWLDRVKGDMTPPKGLDTPAINAVLIGAIQHMVLSADASGSLSGMGLESARDWERARMAIRKLVRGVYP